MAVTWRGHKVWTESRDRRDENPHAQVKFWAVCSCGFRSTWRASEDSATGAALNHLWRETVSPEFPVKGRMVKRQGETMTKDEFVRELQASA
jgi:hypothetical protein